MLARESRAQARAADCSPSCLLGCVLVAGIPPSLRNWTRRAIVLGTSILAAVQRVENDGVGGMIQWRLVPG